MRWSSGAITSGCAGSNSRSSAPSCYISYITGSWIDRVSTSYTCCVKTISNTGCIGWWCCITYRPCSLATGWACSQWENRCAHRWRNGNSVYWSWWTITTCCSRSDCWNTIPSGIIGYCTCGWINRITAGYTCSIKAISDTGGSRCWSWIGNCSSTPATGWTCS